jgi:arginyl-tRNA synthetase
VNCSLPKITYPTLKLLLLVRLDQTIHLQREVILKKGLKKPLEEASLAFNQTFGEASIELRQVRNTTSIAYVSPVALQLASCFHGNPIDLAREITESLSNLEALSRDMQDLNEDLMKFIWRNLNVSLLTSGWIKFELSDRGLAQWLQFCLDHPPRLPAELVLGAANNANALTCQYAYARCSSLLRLGQREGLITLGDGSPDWPWLTPQPLPWLDGDWLWCNTLAERQLLRQIVAVIDDLWDPNPDLKPKKWLTVALELAQAWQVCDREIRIFGQRHVMDLRQSQSRLGLVMLTQRLLDQLLRQRLGICAPLEL